MIPVTKSFIPEIREYSKILNRAFDNGWLTNRGELTLELEDKLKSFLNVSGIILMNNGTTPIQISLKLLANKGEVITTPFSYIATSSSILWENCTPIFADIHPEYLTINEELIEELITDKTTCILATHVFGNPCNIEVIEEIAKKHDLKVIYDAAHSFASEYNGKSVFSYGDISTCSFHATKLFHTGEGGALFSNNEELLSTAYYSHNFGHNGPLEFHGLGINGKISELQSAMGLSVLPHMGKIIDSRKTSVGRYIGELKPGMQFLKIRPGTKWNYSYFPVIFKSEEQLLKVEANLKSRNVLARRYFYPSLNTIPYIKGESCNVSESIASRILCLPLYYQLMPEDQDIVIQTINECI